MVSLFINDALAAHATPPTTPLPAARPRQKPRRNEPRFELRTPLHQLTGVDLSQLDGIGPYHALRLLSEIGTDMTRWPTDKHVTSWLTLAPMNNVSGGRLLSSRTQPSANRAAAILRLAAMNLGRTQTALGAHSDMKILRVEEIPLAAPSDRGHNASLRTKRCAASGSSSIALVLIAK